jgi:hypothetical protein
MQLLAAATVPTRDNKVLVDQPIAADLGVFPYSVCASVNFIC